MRRLLPLALAAAILACAGPRSTARPSPLVGKPVEFSVRRMEGPELTLPARGARATLVDFWATWCEPCREQLPELDRLAAKLRASGLEVYAVSLDEDRAALEEFEARTPVGFPVLWDKGGATVAERLQLTRLPTTLLIDASGVVRAVHVGYESGQVAALERDVRRLLAQPSSAAGPVVKSAPHAR